ncbi:ABC-type transport system involved in cytochrome c biogenesis, permease component [Aequorivita sublithincola DSM 14238]|uniref:ABC-type transport system involved in cytochrome c biogenesis, permease component n=1 Tax=Aequorivita sublithincola (strain DSM 14238 / LMG 21431 / ACAM 643 / 9-3) TaxID=746697 RepID=I3YZL3_AEQSU|nr:cytochrome c biogenesis protein CcsA [Aequorivita sublithincola]AFL82431.1 ABC-type transport system involved in cytochrome c biogenesis, permease component [Aequorivita sublithincola DSM 14238]
MQKKIASVLFSTRLTAVLFIVFAVAMAAGTFMDADSQSPPTPYTRELIYNAWWFEGIMLLFMINFLGNIFRYNLHKRKMWASLMLHLAFILVIVGAFVTRYIGFEGVMHIREGQTENTILSEQTYLDVFIDGDYIVDGVAQRRKLQPKKLRLSEKLNNNFSINTDYNGQPVTIKFKDYISGAKEGLTKAEDGEEYLKIVESGDGERHDHWVKVGEVTDIHNILFAINKPTEGAINITYTEDGNYTISSPFEGNYLRMADQVEGKVAADSVQPFNLRSLYRMGGMAFVVPEPITKGEYGVVRTEAGEPANQDALILEITSKDETKTVELLGGKGTPINPKETEIAGLKVYMGYGSESIDLPFSITLNKFIAEKYPGTEKGYSSFKSKVTVIDEDKTHFDSDIFMNNVLDHNGYRFFQSGFDPDEGGTILSVNHDWWGTWITYIGYFFLYIGMMGILFFNGSRFKNLEKILNRIKKKKANMTMLLVLFVSLSGMAQVAKAPAHTTVPKQKIDSLILANAVSKEHAAKFGHLIIQDNGRMKPINTFASELLRKISRSDSYEGLDANQVFISMTEFPRLWVEVPLIALKWQNDSIRHIAGVPNEQDDIALLDFFDEKGNYKLEPYLEAATRTNTPNQFQKDFIKAHENFSLLNAALSGSILKIFPIPEDPGNKWVSYPELNEANLKGMDSLYAKNILPLYFDSLKKARETGDYKQSDEFLESITNFQKKYGAEVMPSENKLRAETIYNKADIFNRLYKYFTVFGILMMVFIIAQLFNDRKILRRLISASKIIMWVLFAAMTLGLALRWYVSGHAPWSDAYESVVYVAWATIFFGLAFGRRSDLTVAATAFAGAIILWVAHENWLDPSIANLQPVLDSYWLMIHVAVIVMSYGPFTLGLILAAVSLFLMIFTTKGNYKKMEINISELTVVTEMALTVGLVLLTIGNFLGGQWANESWGRYWGWDPKETWALISIMIYAFVIHARLVPGLRGRWTFNVLAMFAYSSIMMTYFGVNFYLSGLHSYASGNAPATPTFVWWIALFAVILSVVSYFRYKKFYGKKSKPKKKAIE